MPPVVVELREEWGLGSQAPDDGAEKGSKHELVLQKYVACARLGNRTSSSP